MIQIFVIHYKKLTERKEHILKQLEAFNLTNYEFIEIDRDDLNNYDISMFDHNNSPAQTAISLSHYYAYEEIAKKYDYALILEDDIILSPRFSEILKEYIDQLPLDYDICFIGDGCNLHIEKHIITPDKKIYKKGNEPTEWGGGGATRCADSYIVNKKCAIQMCKFKENKENKISESIDWWLNRCCKDNNFNVYWAEPTIVTQGTQCGLFKTSY